VGVFYFANFKMTKEQILDAARLLDFSPVNVTEEGYPSFITLSGRKYEL